MGNCQAALDAATVAIQHPAGGRTELAYCALQAAEVMAANPGQYVAAVITASKGTAPAAVKHLKLLRPDDTLQLGHVYRLVSFEEVKLSRVMAKAKDEEEEEVVPKKPGSDDDDDTPSVVDDELESLLLPGLAVRRRHWKPTLQSITEGRD